MPRKGPAPKRPLIVDPVYGSPVVTHLLFGVYLGVIAWAGLWLRDPSLRRLFPLRR